MFDIFKGNVIHKEANNLFLENDTHLRRIYIDDATQYLVGQEYKFYVFNYLMIGNKSIEMNINFGFQNLDDAIGFSELININGVGIKTALKIIRNGYKELLELITQNNTYQIVQKFGVTNTVCNAILDFFNKKNFENFTCEQIKKINSAITSLQQLGYTKQISTKVVWNRREEILKNRFAIVFPLLIEDIKNERINH